jgi:hypothetical protein
MSPSEDVRRNRRRVEQCIERSPNGRRRSPGGRSVPIVSSQKVSPRGGATSSAARTPPERDFEGAVLLRPKTWDYGLRTAILKMSLAPCDAYGFNDLWIRARW